MFAVTLAAATSGLIVGQYVTGYAVASFPQFNKHYKGNPNVIFIAEKDLRGSFRIKFINNCTAFYFSNGKLLVDTTKL